MHTPHWASQHGSRSGVHAASQTGVSAECTRPGRLTCEQAAYGFCQAGVVKQWGTPVCTLSPASAIHVHAGRAVSRVSCRKLAGRQARPCTARMHPTKQEQQSVRCRKETAVQETLSECRPPPGWGLKKTLPHSMVPWGTISRDGCSCTCESASSCRAGTPLAEAGGRGIGSQGSEGIPQETLGGTLWGNSDKGVGVPRPGGQAAGGSIVARWDIDEK